jgi:hypothetical protein
MTATATPIRDYWSSWHLHVSALGAPATDRVIRHVVAPAVDWCRRPWPAPAPWFFIRYWQFGPHVRLRVGGLDQEREEQLDAWLRDSMAELTGAAPGALTPAEYQSQVAALASAGEGDGPLELGELWPPGVYRQPYRPEVDRYGGPDLMPLSESLFQESSELTLAFTGRNPPEAARKGLGLRATWAAVEVLAEDRRTPFCRRAAHRAAAWAPAGATGRAAAPATGLERPAPAPVRRWVDRLRQAMDQWPAADGERILHAHIHMLHNRLGLGLDQELIHYRALATAATGPAALVEAAP